MALKHKLLIWVAVIVSNCYSADIQPVTDDIDERTEPFRPVYLSPQYYNVKRSFIYPQYDIEKFALVPEEGNDEKKDSIKGPSINPVIENIDNEGYGAENVDENGSYLGLKPENLVEETGKKFSAIARENEPKTTRRHKKISEKEKEAISAGLIKLLYDWKLRKEHKNTGSGSGESLRENKEELKEEKKHEEATKGEGKDDVDQIKEESHANDNEVPVQKTNGVYETGLNDPLKEKKIKNKNVEDDEQMEDTKEEVDKDEEEENQDQSSGEIKATKRKGKISVLVNVNINERSLRSKVSRAGKKRLKQKSTNTVRILNKENETSKEKDDYYDDDDGDDDDEADDDDDEGSTEQLTNSSSATAAENDTNQTPHSYAQPTYQYGAPASSPQTAWTARSSQTVSPSQQNYAYYGSQNSNPYQYTNNYIATTTAKASTAKASTPHASTAHASTAQGLTTGTTAAVTTSSRTTTEGPTTNSYKTPVTTSKPEEDDEDSSGEQEYNLLEQRIQEEGAKDLKKKEKKHAKVKPAKLVTVPSKQRNAQIYLPGSMQTLTEKHEEKTKPKGKEKEKLDEDEEEHGSIEDETSEEEEDESKATEIDLPKKKRKLRKHTHKKPAYSETETFQQNSGKDEKSTAVPKYSKPKDNPKQVTNQVVETSNRPLQATEVTEDSTSHIAMKKAEKFGNAKNLKDEPVEKVERFGSLQKEGTDFATPLKATEGSGEKVHFVKIHDSEIKLLKEHRAKIQSSEPIVIDDIKKKNEKPKQNPVEAIEQHTTKKKATHNNVKQGLADEEQVEAKPTTKRNYITPVKPEVVAPPSEKTVDKGKQTSKEGEKTKTKPVESKTTTEEAEGSGNFEKKKYGSLKSVRQRFKEWEKEMIAKLSNPYLKVLENDEGSGEDNEKTFKSWSEEEKDLISKLANPFLHSGNSSKPNKTAEKGSLKIEKTQRKNESETKKNQSEIVSLVKEHLTTNAKDEKSTAKPQVNHETSSELPVQKNKEEAKNTSKTEENMHETKIQSFVPEEEKKVALHESVDGKDVDVNELEKFKSQIITEVGKINKLQDQYKKKLVGSKELKNAKDTLKKDLKFIKDIELKLTNGIKNGAETKDDSKKEKTQKEEKDSNDKKEIKKKMTKAIKKAGKESHDPLVKIQSLLKEEMHRTKNKKKGKDKQLDNIRGLLKQELKNLIKSGKLGSPDDLPSGLQKLGKMIQLKLKSAKKKKSKKKKTKKGEKQVKGKELKNSLDFIKEFKPTVPGSSRGHITTMSRFKAAKEALKALKEQQAEAERLAVTTNSNSSTSENATGAINIHHASPTKPHVLLPANLPTGHQAEKFKELLKNLNKKIGEVYTKLQSSGAGQQSNNNNQNNNNNNNQQQQQQQQQTQQQAFSNDWAQAGMMGSNNQQPATAEYGAPAQSPFNNYNSGAQDATPMANSYIDPQAKHEMPSGPVDYEPPEPDTVLAESEPVETLIENLEKDITEVWSFKEQYADAASLGLDNDKIHSTYANLGSLSGLNLRRSLDRALRGKDVGLVIVGGSISKGGPFSEKGVDYALKTYFYAIADWWNKIIRPVTGSSMVIRDVSIGGIATDYYSYCLRTHLPDDRMTNIVLWELSANDMHRYDETLKPRQQSLEQFTQDVLSYKAKPALIFLNFFALFSWDKDLATHCRNFEDEGESDIAKHYKITSLSWRDMVCSLMQRNEPLFTRDELFSEDQFHPSIEAHAQMAYVVIDYIRTEFLKSLVKQRFLEIGDAARKLKIPETVYVPKPIYQQTFTWKPLCYTYMLVDNKIPNNTLSVKEETNGDFHYTVLREFKVRSDKIIGMDTKKSDQYITYEITVPPHPGGSTVPYKKLAIMSFTDDRQAEIKFDNSPIQKVDAAKKFLEGTVLKYVATDVVPGNHKLLIRSGPNGFVISAIMLG